LSFFCHKRFRRLRTRGHLHCTNHARCLPPTSNPPPPVTHRPPRMAHLPSPLLTTARLIAGGPLNAASSRSGQTPWACWLLTRRKRPQLRTATTARGLWEGPRERSTTGRRRFARAGLVEGLEERGAVGLGRRRRGGHHYGGSPAALVTHRRLPQRCVSLDGGRSHGGAALGHPRRRAARPLQRCRPVPVPSCYRPELPTPT